MYIQVPSHLYLSEFGVYHFRITVPPHFRKFLGKPEIKKTLKTGNRQEAIKLARRMSVQVCDVFEELKLMVDKEGKYPDLGIVCQSASKVDPQTALIKFWHHSCLHHLLSLKDKAVMIINVPR